ncbi:hypothetical protein [Pseudonocardia sp. ICBG1293]|uniref:hypothetical protein n=1 Tax=Pseudonocardia sp. ICBG1293 TaxID=2844382 RepID=UPI001CC96D5F|nr:hypothetical protein [Pseudonocardia sp. ICBG1293]
MAQHARDRRESRALEARLAREDADAAARRKIAEQNAREKRDRIARDAAQRRKAEQRKTRAETRSDARQAALSWLDAHVVELLIYPIAVLSFALAAPAMAAYGSVIFGATGFLLAGITELGMWAFALAVVASRHRHPHRPVAGLRVGVVVFSLGAAGMNFTHGLHKAGGGWTVALVMAVVSVAGIVAHQLTLAGAPRSRAERRADQLAARAAVKIDRAQHAALRAAAIVIAADGTAQLVYHDGTYHLDRRHRLISPTAPTKNSPSPGAPAGPEIAADDAVETGSVHTGPVNADSEATLVLPTVVRAESGEDETTDHDAAADHTVDHAVETPEWTARYEALPGETKLAKAELFLTQSWDHGHEPALARVDRMIDAPRTATAAKRNLRARGILPPSERVTAATAKQTGSQTDSASTRTETGLVSVNALLGRSKPA